MQTVGAVCWASTVAATNTLVVASLTVATCVGVLVRLTLGETLGVGVLVDPREVRTVGTVCSPGTLTAASTFLVAWLARPRGAIVVNSDVVSWRTFGNTCAVDGDIGASETCCWSRARATLGSTLGVAWLAHSVGILVLLLRAGHLGRSCAVDGDAPAAQVSAA